ncbi:MAG TPA: O-antigen ligase family protein [Opitutaceae bacterium]|jgi:O-antigen ligase|nr:O-antigen ligase family protein [Opitutaceae bacterium]
MSPDTSAQRFTRILCALGLAGLVALTLVDKGATRMYSWPWWLVFWFVQLAPAAALFVRTALDPRPLALPAIAWRWPLGLFAAVELAAALASPFRAPSLPAAATLLAGLAAGLLLFDWLQVDATETKARLAKLERALGWFFAVVLADSLGSWLLGVIIPNLRAGQIASLHGLFSYRNEQPLGHSNYTGGLAVFMLPWLGARVTHTRGRARFGWAAAIALALFMLFTSGSRGAVLGLAGLLLAALALAWRRDHLRTKHAVLLAAAAIALTAVFALVNPRIRDLLATETSSAPPVDSAVQRSAMFVAGLRMGSDRPLLGWGPGVTPLVYPRYRARLDGGVETALQLHSTPVQIWADTGAPGLICLLALVALVTCSLWKKPAPATAGLALVGYGIFALTDFQLDVPIFLFLSAAGLAACAPPAAGFATPRVRAALALALIAAAALISTLGGYDPTPALNLDALALDRDPAQASRARALFEKSLALNPEQEIAHFNLGWLILVSDPAAAEMHFLAAAHLVPDKGGVYFGLGLARLNQGRDAAAAQAFALECLNDPVFVASPWWRTSALAPLRASTGALVAQYYRELATRLPPSHWPGPEAHYTSELSAWLFGRLPGRAVAAAATTPARRDFFARDPAPALLLAAPALTYRRERPGYPVLMRNLDLPVPVDLFDVQENALATGPLAFLFPKKGWLPSPLLIEFLDNPRPSPR